MASINRVGRIAWAAGFLDGEGHLGILNPGRYGTPMIQAAQSATREPLDLLMELFSGSICRKKRPAPSLHPFVWTLGTANGVALALDELTPWLVVKRDQAHVLRAYCDLITRRGTTRISDELADRRIALQRQLIALRKAA